MMFKHFWGGYFPYQLRKEERTGLIASPVISVKGGLRRKGGDSPWL